MAAALGGLDAIMFTALVSMAPVCASGSAGMPRGSGLELDAEANAANGPRISTAASPVTAWVRFWQPQRKTTIYDRKFRSNEV